MKSIERGLFIGRFQPFHLGHRMVINRMSKVVDEVVIGIGSSEDSYTKQNPFTADERREMIENSLSSGLRYKIIDIPDIHDDARWVEYVVNLCPEFRIVYSGNSWVEGLFSKAGYSVMELGRHKNISATLVRESIISGKPWARLVPVGTYQVIKNIGGVERIISTQKGGGDEH